jgi:hypothetical protein
MLSSRGIAFLFLQLDMLFLIRGLGGAAMLFLRLRRC